MHLSSEQVELKKEIAVKIKIKMEIDDVHIVKSEDSPSEDRSDRLEEPWSEKHDRYLNQMKLETLESSTNHAQRAARCRY